MAKSYSIYEAKARFSEVIRGLKRHAKIIITYRGNPIAQILPFEQPAPSFDERIATLEEEGRISPRPQIVATWKPILKRTNALKRFLDDRDA